MPKFTKESSELETHFEKWMFVIRNMSRLDKVLSEPREQVFEEFFKAAEIAHMSPADRAIYEENRKRYLDFTNSMTSAEERGEERGRIETAKNLLRMNIPLDVIQKGTELLREKIEEIRNSLNGEADTKKSCD